MSLATEVTTRYSAYVILGITNPDDTSAVANGTAMLTAACTDATADFNLLAQVDYDATDPMHLRIAVERVVAILYSRLMREGGEKRMGDTRKMLEDLAAVSSRSRILPQTTSVVVPTSELEPDGTTPRPDFDRSRFADFAPGAPAAPDRWTD